jgi:hypothetical protein
VTVGVIGAKGRSDVTGWYAAQKLSQSASVCAWGQGSVAEAKFGGRSSDGSSRRAWAGVVVQLANVGIADELQSS